MATVIIYENSNNPIGIQRQIDSIKSLADAVEHYAGTMLGCEIMHEQAQIDLMQAAIQVMADVHALTK